MKIFRTTSGIVALLAVASFSPAQLTEKKSLTQKDARKVIAAILSAADDRRNNKGSIAVIDAGGNLLALEHAGLPGARLYPGSWSEWSSDPSRPIEVG